MGEYIPKIKDVFRVPSGSDGQLHLHVVITDKCEVSSHILVGISSLKEGSRQNDLSCKIEAGEHALITKESFAFYKHAKHESEQLLKKCVGNTWPLCDPISDSLLERIRAGLMISEHTKPFILECFEHRCLN